MDRMVFEKKWSHFMYPVSDGELRDPIVKPDGRVETTFSDKMLLEGMRVATSRCQYAYLRSGGRLKLEFGNGLRQVVVETTLRKVTRLDNSQPTLSGEARDKLIRMALESAKRAGFIYIYRIVEAQSSVDGHVTTSLAISGAEIPGEEVFVLKNQGGDEEIEWVESK